MRRPIQLRPGGLLVVTSDGISEAMNAAGELMGAERLREELERNADQGAECTRAAGGSRRDHRCVINRPALTLNPRHACKSWNTAPAAHACGEHATG